MQAPGPHRNSPHPWVSRHSLSGQELHTRYTYDLALYRVINQGHGAGNGKQEAVP